jgi:hypothetical protein
VGINPVVLEKLDSSSQLSRRGFPGLNPGEQLLGYALVELREGVVYVSH